MSNRKKILIYGATSAIVHETAKLFANENCDFIITGRDSSKLRTIEADLRARGAGKIVSAVHDADYFLHCKDIFLKKAIEDLDGLDIVIIGYGTLSKFKSEISDSDATLQTLNTNFMSIVVQLTYIANYFEEKRSGIIAVITSVAGDLGRKQNYIYASSKAGLSIFLQGLRGRMLRSGVSVVDIRPGYVATAMTSHLKKNFLFSSSQEVGEGVYRAIKARKGIVYLPRFWRFIMGILKMLPEKLLHRLNI
ncbi:MAG: SDR family NAD(P)-dependent oxidoreductase [Bdellovibrionota bacterium]